ncbi:MAG: hypothetical protein HY271_02030 [Deltaproteobacteria bacterium]|nr:hypothetical protein [Deltaproteobacteria bacterium]
MNPSYSQRSTRARTLDIGALIAVALAIGAPTWSAESGDDIALPPPGRAGWRELTFPRVVRTTKYTAAQSGTLETVRAVSDCSASAL